MFSPNAVGAPIGIRPEVVFVVVPSISAVVVWLVPRTVLIMPPLLSVPLPVSSDGVPPPHDPLWVSSITPVVASDPPAASDNSALLAPLQLSVACTTRNWPYTVPEPSVSVAAEPV
jgi:hypothetical protein